MKPWALLRTIAVSQFAGKKLRGKRKRRRDAEDGEGVAAPPQASAYDALLGSLSRANGGAEASRQRGTAGPAAAPLPSHCIAKAPRPGPMQPIRRHLREREGDSEGSGGRGEDDAGSSGDDAQSAGSARAPVVARAVAGSAGDLAGTSEAVVGLCGEPPWQPEGAGEPTKDAIKDAQDALERHVSHVLADDEVAALAGPSGRAHAVEWGPGRGAEVAATWAPDAALRATRSRGSAEGPRMAARLRDMGVKERCVARWREEVLGGSAPAPGDTDFLTREQQALFALLRSFRDVVYPLYRYPDASRALGLPGRGCGGGPGDAVMDAVLLHIVDHVARSADTVRKNNAVAEEAKAAGRPLDEVRGRAGWGCVRRGWRVHSGWSCPEAGVGWRLAGRKCDSQNAQCPCDRAGATRPGLCAHASAVAGADAQRGVLVRDASDGSRSEGDTCRHVPGQGPFPA